MLKLIGRAVAEPVFTVTPDCVRPRILQPSDRDTGRTGQALIVRVSPQPRPSACPRWVADEELFCNTNYLRTGVSVDEREEILHLLVP
ncbi:hypothetical protein [Micromonospora avicenniae]|uniref:hypothetical protein n=1 Tax=Micromonospora avicenniae TaxID=1198245 RepID=UPI001115848C|nr:hypothetical protein [Micromonospora avicenniae]